MSFIRKTLNNIFSLISKTQGIIKKYPISTIQFILQQFFLAWFFLILIIFICFSCFLINSCCFFSCLLMISNCLSPWYSIPCNCSLFLSSIFFNLFKSHSFLLNSSNVLLKTLLNGKYSNLAFSTTPGLYAKYSPVKYSYFSNSLDDNA